MSGSQRRGSGLDGALLAKTLLGALTEWDVVQVRRYGVLEISESPFLALLYRLSLLLLPECHNSGIFLGDLSLYGISRGSRNIGGIASLRWGNVEITEFDRASRGNDRVVLRVFS